MEMKPLKHQEKFITGYSGSNLLVHEGGTGKTVCGCLWLKDGRDEDALVICPKRVVEKWKTALKDWGTKATVLYKEQFKKTSLKTSLKTYSAVIVDEADDFASPLFTKGRSQLTTVLYKLLKDNPSMPRLLLTATPIRSHPWNLHTLLAFKGRYIDWKEWRSAFFELTRRPYLPYPAWLPKSDWRQNIRKVLEKHADIVLLKDCIGELPPATEKIVKCKVEKFETNKEWEPKEAFVERHQFEQKDKHKDIIEIGKNFRKVLVVAYYVEQIKELEKQLSKDRTTYTVYGQTKSQEEVLKEANEVDECFLIVQASLGAGFDADSFSCVIFTSMSYSVRDWIQMKYRVRRIHNLHPVEYNYLIAGKADQSVFSQVMLGKDFSPSEWNEKD